MKSNAIIRIVLFSLAIVILVGILVGGIGFRSYLGNKVENSITRRFTLEDGATASTGSVPASQIRDIEIQWVAGNITIQPGDTDSITFAESSGVPEADQMVWKQSGDKLILQFSQAKFSFDFTTDFAKDLIVTVPQDWSCSDLDIDAVSADLDISGLTVNEMDIETVSGKCDLSGCGVNKIALETVSGDLAFEGTLERMDFESVSATCTATLSNTPKELDFDSLSGDLILTLPENTGFTAKIDSLSGEISSEFPTTVSKNTHTYGDGGCRINADTMSGSMLIKKGELQ